MRPVIHWFLSTLAVMIAAYILPDEAIFVQSFFVALVVAVVLGFLNTIIKPILIILTLPIEIVTLGLFTFVINAFLVMVTSAIVPGFHITNFWWALAFSLVLWLINTVLHHFEPSKKRHNREHI
ncbi:MAG TPA: phage holin family protein [Candidatus Moranbacteria bacterium]|jgi:putative membrane protein|nr:phage holin family protein [Candidatus Moranbacteria bacterium]HPX94287.1 phage holin family protein [Candidatus Moranbacteria bacterium]HQB59565.1 phage holin family protein [Candidatus Moranbacteria bacterium]